MSSKNPHAVALGRKGGKSRSRAKVKAARETLNKVRGLRHADTPNEAKRG